MSHVRPIVALNVNLPGDALVGPPFPLRRTTVERVDRSHVED